MPALERAVIVVVAAAAGIGGYLLGGPRTGARAGDPSLAAENDRLRERVAALERDLAARPIPLAGSGGARADGSTAGGAPGSGPAAGGPRVPGGSPPRPGDEVPFPTRTEGMTQDEFVKEAFRFLEAQLARGTEGHLAILKALDEHLVKDRALQRWLGSEEDAARFVYPLVKFAVLHEGQVVDLMATTFRAMAETPQVLEGIDDDTFELFTEGLGFALPGAVAPEQLAKFSGWVEKVLAAPEKSLPKGIEGNRGELARLLRVWAPPMGVDDAVALLARPEAVAPARLIAVVRRLPKEALAKVDLVPIVGAMLDHGAYEALDLLRQVEPSPADLVALDRREIAALDRDEAVHAGSYLHATRRADFAAAQAFFDAWGASPDVVGDTYLIAAMNFRAPAAYLRDALARQKVSPNVAEGIQRHIERLESSAARPR